MTPQEKEKQSTLNLFLRWAVFLAFLLFSLLSVLWLGLKIELAKHLSTEMDVIALIDIIRSHLSLDLAIALLLLLCSRKNLGASTRVASLVLFILMTFYFLKLTGLYAYTYDATPWKMIEYGSYLLHLPLAGNFLSAFFYLFLPASLLAFISINLYLASKKQTPKNKITSLTLVSIFIGISFACIPPLQNRFLYSLSFHPYIYSVSGAFIKDSQDNSNNTNEIKKSQLKTESITSLENINIVFIILESFSESTIQAHITPKLYELRNNSLNFSHAYANIPHTSKALVNILCGEAYLSPYLYESVYGAKENCLAHLLNKESVFFQGITKTFENREALVKAMGFNDFHFLESMDTKGYEAVNYFSYEDDIVLPVSSSWLNALSSVENKDFFSVYLTGITHHNYQTPGDFEKSEFSSLKNENDYLNAALYVDQFVAKLLQQYQENGLMENTLFVFVGDHGEGFDDKQALMHNNNLFQSGLHIPLFIYAPELLQASTVDTPFSQNHIKELLLSYQSSSGQFDYLIAQEEKSIISSCWYMDYCYAITRKIDGDIYKLIDDKRNKRQLLYNLTKDPEEKINQFKEQSGIASQLMNGLTLAVDRNHHEYQIFFADQDRFYHSKKDLTFSVFRSVTSF